ncbi:MAG: AarF/ABC1/UbiB kinase family protein, partial [Patescibacteria group bacterium]
MFLIFLILGRTISVIFIVLRYSIFSKCSNDVKLKLILQDLGGVFVKLGQIMAMRFDILPSKYAYTLWDLFDKEPPLSNEEVLSIFKRETGKDIKEVFEYLEESPIAVASFAQVYKATLNGNDVVIKIQKPGIKYYIKADLTFLKFIAFILDIIGVLKSITAREVIIQLEYWLKDEFDYRIEANNSQIIYKHIKEKHKLKNVFSPKIYWDYVTEKVLVQEFINGYSVNELILDIEKNKEKTEKYLEQNNINLKVAAEEFVVDIMRQYFVDGFFQADPHPANLFILPGNKIAWIDFG